MSFTPHLEILPPAQRAIWPMLTGIADLGFVLYGGTAIGLRLNHRPSIDFDFFTDKPLHRDALFRALPFLKLSTILQDQPDTYTVLVPSEDSKVKLSFFADMQLGRVGTPEATDDGVLEVASLEDLMATKVKVVLQRIEEKDYSDIAAMLRAGVPLDRGLAAARVLYGSAFAISESVKALVYFEGGDLASLSLPDREVLTRAVEAVGELPTMRLASPGLSAHAR